MSAHDQPDLLSHVVHLRAVLEDPPRGEFLGREAHALFLSVIEDVNPSLAAQLHDSPALKPFTVSPLIWEGNRRAWLRFTVFGPTVARSFAEALDSGLLGPRIRLGQTEFEVADVYSDVLQHPWSATDSYEALWERHMRSRSTFDRRIALHFVTPTTFRAQQKTTPLPQPELVFSSLLTKWNAFSPRPLNRVAQDYFRDGLSVSRHELQTDFLDLGRGRRQVGFRGVCEFVGSSSCDEGLRAARMLAEYAFYAGVGYKATMGMGMATPTEPADSVMYRMGEDGRSYAGGPIAPARTARLARV